MKVNHLSENENTEENEKENVYTNWKEIENDNASMNGQVYGNGNEKDNPNENENGDENEN